jgi:hypothetical protein
MVFGEGTGAGAGAGAGAGGVEAATCDGMSRARRSILGGRSLGCCSTGPSGAASCPVGTAGSGRLDSVTGEFVALLRFRDGRHGGASAAGLARGGRGSGASASSGATGSAVRNTLAVRAADSPPMTATEWRAFAGTAASAEDPPLGTGTVVRGGGGGGFESSMVGIEERFWMRSWRVAVCRSLAGRAVEAVRSVLLLVMGFGCGLSTDGAAAVNTGLSATTLDRFGTTPVAAATRRDDTVGASDGGGVVNGGGGGRSERAAGIV